MKDVFPDPRSEDDSRFNVHIGRCAELRICLGAFRSQKHSTAGGLPEDALTVTVVLAFGAYPAQNQYVKSRNCCGLGSGNAEEGMPRFR